MERESLEGVIFNREVRHLSEKVIFEKGFKEMGEGEVHHVDI